MILNVREKNREGLIDLVMYIVIGLYLCPFTHAMSIVIALAMWWTVYISKQVVIYNCVLNSDRLHHQIEQDFPIFSWIYWKTWECLGTRLGKKRCVRADKEVHVLMSAFIFQRLTYVCDVRLFESTYSPSLIIRTPSRNLRVWISKKLG